VISKDISERINNINFRRSTAFLFKKRTGKDWRFRISKSRKRNIVYQSGID